MARMARIAFTIATAAMAYGFMLVLVGPLLLRADSLSGIRVLLALVVAVVVGRWAWTHGWDRTAGILKSALIGGVVLGTIGFGAGFFGPLIFRPEANQGPLLGIFITGPLGFVVGLIVGFVYGWMRRRNAP